MKICIGIISYFPDDERRKVRINRFRFLLNQLNSHFKLPIIIALKESLKLTFLLFFSISILRGLLDISLFFSISKKFLQ